MSVPHINQVFNGACAAIWEEMELMLAEISEHYNIPIEDLRNTAYAASDKQKPKAIKLQKRQPKRAGGIKKERKVAAYHIFTREKRKESKDLLVDDEKERTFKNKEGEMITIEIGEKGPSFTQITQKLASMWGDLADESKVEYETKAQNEPPRQKKVPVKKGAKGKKAVDAVSGTSGSSSDSSSISTSITTDSSNDGSSDLSESLEKAVTTKKGKAQPAAVSRPLPKKKSQKVEEVEEEEPEAKPEKAKAETKAAPAKKGAKSQPAAKKGGK